MDLSIIIVNWKSKSYLQKCLASIYANTRSIEFEIVVIDSGSFDGCEQMLCEEFPKVRFIQSETNLGFAQANNTAFHISRGEHVLFLNPDTEVVGAALPLMLKCLRELPDAGSVGCKLLNTDGSVQTSCIQSVPTILNQMLDSEFLRARWPKAALWGTAVLYEDHDQPQPVEAISGACVMVKRAVFEQVGGFSEDYFMYSEDIDLCYNLTERGWKNYYLPKAAVVHHGGGSSSVAVSQFAIVMMRQSIWLFLRKTRGDFYAGFYRCTTMIAALLRILLLLLTLPILEVFRRGEAWRCSLGKWQAVFRWVFLGQRALD